MTDIADKILNDKKGKVKPQRADNMSKLQIVGHYIQSKYEVRFNEVSCKVEYRKKEVLIISLN